MIIRRPWKRKQFTDEKKFRTNQQIKSSLVFLIDENGESIGEMPTNEALDKAQNLGLDLVEVNPKADPPIVKIMDYGQFKYEQDKQKHKQKLQQKKVELKAIRLSARISDHDLELRVSQSTKFLLKGNKVKLELNLKGRERQHTDRAIEIINSFVQSLEKNPELSIAREQDLTRQGSRFTIVIINKQNKV